jgi:hypothetical protein
MRTPYFLWTKPNKLKKILKQKRICTNQKHQSVAKTIHIVNKFTKKGTSLSPFTPTIHFNNTKQSKERFVNSTNASRETEAKVLLALSQVNVSDAVSIDKILRRPSPFYQFSPSPMITSSFALCYDSLLGLHQSIPSSPLIIGDGTHSNLVL